MSSCLAAPSLWERFKEEIHSLFIIDNQPLDGANGVIEQMKARHKFEATKAQYEVRLRKWGFGKYAKGTNPKDWQIVLHKVQSAKRKLVRRRKSPSRRTPPDFSICLRTPSPEPRAAFSPSRMLIRSPERQLRLSPPCSSSPFIPLVEPSQRRYRAGLVFQTLPFMSFKDTLRMVLFPTRENDINGASSQTVIQEVRDSPVRGAISTTKVLKSVLPLEFFRPHNSQDGVGEYLSDTNYRILASFLVSNNFPGHLDGTQLYPHLKVQGLLNKSLLNILARSDNPSAATLLEKLFRLAVEALDLPMVKNLLQAGVNPRGKSCWFGEIPEAITGLEYACISGDITLAMLLLSHGCQLEEPATGWTASILVLAIIGWETKPLHERVRVIEINSSVSENVGMAQESDATRPLLFLIRKLVDVGAKINIPRNYQPDDLFETIDFCSARNYR
ncbi:hypothetical protein GQ53DRAFT_823628 [Thozetella sp. PMI_491]|nr:hypothetical protein GQ53DRAFT_823628 [Thozetella sp. PMI_491]